MLRSLTLDLSRRSY